MTSDSTYEQLAQQPLLGDNILATIAQTARDILAARQKVTEAEEALKTAQAELKALVEDTMPELMATAGQEQLTTIDGLVVSIKEMTRGQPSKEKAPEAFKWLRDNGHGGIIKTKVEVDLGKGDKERVEKVRAALAELKVPATLKQDVHHQTLGALVRELLSKGKKVPLETLGVFMWKQASVKPKG